jgi:hypothetical protein
MISLADVSNKSTKFERSWDIQAVLMLMQRHRFVVKFPWSNFGAFGMLVKYFNNQQGIYFELGQCKEGCSVAFKEGGAKEENPFRSHVMQSLPLVALFNKHIHRQHRCPGWTDHISTRGSSSIYYTALYTGCIPPPTMPLAHPIEGTLAGLNSRFYLDRHAR